VIEKARAGVTRDRVERPRMGVKVEFVGG